MNKPFSFLLIPFIIGILSTYFFKLNSYLPLALMVFIFLYLLYNIINKRFNQSILLALFFTLGLSLSMFSNSSNLIDFLDETHEYRASVHKILLENEERGRYILKIEEVDGNPIDKEKIVLNIIHNETFVIGDTITFDAKLKLPVTNTNPRLYNYRLNLKSKGVHTTSTIQEYNIKSIDNSTRNASSRFKINITNSIQSLFNEYLNDSNASLMTSIILGKSSYLEEDFLQMYRDMGLAHILAVSGLHIGIISGFIFFLLSRIGVKRKTNVLLTLAIIWIYGFVIDFPPSILRANIMFSILYYSQLIHQPYDSLNTLSFAALILLVINPYYIFNIGFQLSFIATLSILILYPKIKEVFSSYKSKFTDTLSALLSVHIGLLPVQAYYFNSISILSILANIIIVPILTFSIILSVLMIIFSYSFNFLNSGIGLILNLLLNIQFFILNVLNRMPLNIFKIFSPAIISIIFYYIAVSIVFKIIGISKLDIKIVKAMIMSLILIVAINLFAFINEDLLELHFIDVGQGDSILIRSRNKNYLVDTGGSLGGNFDIGKNITLPYLEKNGVKNLESVFISHFHVDHCQGLDLLMDELNIKYIYSSYFPGEIELGEKIKNSETPFIILNKGDKLALDKLLEMEILWPEKNSGKKYDENNLSLTCLLKFKDFKILLTGDLENEAESILKNYVRSVDLVKVPHHGSDTSSSEAFLKALSPGYAIISVGRNNLYGHPSKEIVNRYIDMGSRLYRTDENGLIKLRLDKKGLKIGTYLENGEKIVLTPWEFINNNMFQLIIYSLFFLVCFILIEGYYGGRNNYELL